jgi:hypothetical protein
MQHSPSTQHKVYPTLHDLVLDELVVSNLNEVWNATVVMARAFEHVEIVVEAAFTV